MAELTIGPSGLRFADSSISFQGPINFGQQGAELCPRADDPLMGAAGTLQRAQ
jgi:hypothetical protein